MHEVGLMQNILDAAVERTRQEGVQHIDVIEMRIGEASGVVPESLTLAFDIVKKGTIAKDALLQVHYLPIICYCSNCNTEFKPIDILCECPECHQPYCEIRQGKEFELYELKVS